MAGELPDAPWATAAPALPDAPWAIAPVDAPSVTGDVLKSGGIGVVKGALGIAGLPGDARELIAKGINAGSKALGYELPQESVSSALKLVPTLGTPTSQQLRGATETVTGPLYEAKTVPGQFAEKVGEFAPALLTPGGIVRKVASTVIPAVADEAAGQLTKGTAAEPYARAASAITGSILAHKVTTPPVLATARPTAAQLIETASQGYKRPEIEAVTFKPTAVTTLADDILTDLGSRRLNDRLVPKTRGIIEDLKIPVNPVSKGGPVAHTIEDLETTRRNLQTVAGNFADKVEQGAATSAIKAIDRYMAKLPQSDLLTGDAAIANKILTTARANYASGKTAERVLEKITNADLMAGSTYSGGNIDNATRQKLRPLLTSSKQGRGLTEAELGLIEDTVRGSATGNVLRGVGKLMGGGGGWGSLASAMIGNAALGPLGMALPAVGFGLKKVGDKLTKSSAEKIVNAIVDRSPEARQWAAMQARINAAQPAQLGYSDAGLLSGLLSSGANQPMPIGQR